MFEEPSSWTAARSLVFAATVTGLWSSFGHKAHLIGFKAWGQQLTAFADANPPRFFERWLARELAAYAVGESLGVPVANKPTHRKPRHR